MVLLLLVLMLGRSEMQESALLISPKAGDKAAPIIYSQEGPQTDAFACAAMELLYGGGVFGGKTFWGVIDALGLQYEKTPLGKFAIEEPEYRGILLRRETSQLVKFIDESNKTYRYYGGRFVYHRPGEPGMSWTFPRGAKIFFNNLQLENDKYNYDTMEFQFMLWDQLEQFTLTQYLHLFGRLRSTIPNLFVRNRSTCNWIGSGLKWVRGRFPRALKPNEVKWFVPDMDNSPEKNPAGIDVTEKILSGTATEKEKRDAVSRMFIPALYTDNKIGLERDPSYPARIRMQGKKHEQALLNGDPEAFSGDFFSNFNPSMRDWNNPQSKGQQVEPFKVPERWKLIGSFDPGWTSPCSFGLKALDLTGKHYRVATYYEAGRGMRENVKGIMQMMRSCAWTGGRIPEMVVSGHDAWAKHTKLEIIGEELTYADLFEMEGIILDKAVTDRVNGWGAWDDLMRRDAWFYFSGLNEPIVDEIQAAEHDEKDVNDLKGKGDSPEVADHALDEERYGVMAVYLPQPRKKETGWAAEHRERAKKGGSCAKWRLGF